MADRFDAVGLGKMDGKELYEKLDENLQEPNMFYASLDLYARVSMGSSLVYWVSCEEDDDDDKRLLIKECDFHFHSAHRNGIHYCKAIKSDVDPHMVQVHLLAEDIKLDIPLNVSIPLESIQEVFDFTYCGYAQIAAYAETVQYWPNKEAYDALLQDGIALSDEHIIPIGFFPDSEAEQTPRALLGGKITAVERCTNTFTNQDYWHITLSSLGDVFDVLVAPETLEGEPAVGGILQGQVWLSAMLYREKEDEDFLTSDGFTSDYGKHHDTPEECQDEAGCTMCVTRPISDGILQRIATIIESLRNPSEGFLTVEFADRPKKEFIQVASGCFREDKYYYVEYSCIEDGKQIMRTRRYLTLEETVEIFATACRKLPEEFEFGDWLDTGYEEKPDEPETLTFDHYYSDESLNTQTTDLPNIIVADDFADCTDEEACENSIFRMVIESDKGVELSESERHALTAIVDYIVSAIDACGIYANCIQVGFCNDPNGALLWKEDEENKGRYHIALCVDTLDDWSQTIYQLGYVLTHCLLDYCFEPIPAPWMTETICEMMQIWLLSSFASNWEKCELSKEDPDYDECLRAYLHEYMTDQDWADKSAQCTTMKKLLAMNDHAEEHSADRVGTVIHLYYLTMPGDIHALFDAGFHTLGENSGLVDTKAWLQANPHSIAVQYLASLQDHAVYKDAEFKKFLLSIGKDPKEYWNRSDDDDDDLNA